MQPTVTHLPLLRHTPFFSELDTAQLRWVIQHSREWEVQPGETIASSLQTGSDGGYWVLLDGGWDLTYQGRGHSSGNADPGKWFHCNHAMEQPFALVANDVSYVMNFTTQDLEVMLERGFRLHHHLTAGKKFYDQLTSSALSTPTRPSADPEQRSPLTIIGTSLSCPKPYLSPEHLPASDS